LSDSANAVASTPLIAASERVSFERRDGSVEGNRERDDLERV
jgi:hypothetical protein